MKRYFAGPGVILIALLLAAAGAAARSCAPAAQKDAADWCRVNGPGTVCDPCNAASYIVCPEDDENASPRVEHCAPGTLWDTSGARCVGTGRPRAECVSGIDVIVPSTIAGADKMNDVQTYSTSEIDPQDTGEDGAPIDLGPPPRPLSGDESFGRGGGDGSPDMLPSLRDLLPPPFLGAGGPLGGLLGGLASALAAGGPSSGGVKSGGSGSSSSGGGSPLRMTMIMGRMGGPDGPKLEVIERSFPSSDDVSSTSQLQGHLTPAALERELASAVEASADLKRLGAPFGALPPNPLAGLLAGLTGLLGGAADEKKSEGGGGNLEEMERADNVLERLLASDRTVSAASVQGQPTIDLSGDTKKDADLLAKSFIARLGPIARDAAFRSLLVNAEPNMRDNINARRAAPPPALPSVAAAAAEKLAAGRISTALAPVLAARSAGAGTADELASALQLAPMDSILVDNKPQLMPSPRLARAVGGDAALRESLQTALEELFYDEVIEADLGADAGVMFDFDQAPSPAAPKRPAPTAGDEAAAPPVPAPFATGPLATAPAPPPVAGEGAVQHGRHERRHSGKPVAPVLPGAGLTAETRGSGAAAPPPAEAPRGVHPRRGRSHQHDMPTGPGVATMH